MQNTLTKNSIPTPTKVDCHQITSQLVTLSLMSQILTYEKSEMRSWLGRRQPRRAKQHVQAHKHQRCRH